MENIRWVKPDNLHITLRFLGDTSENLVNKISGVMEKHVTKTQPFSFVIRSLDVFRSLKYPRVMWMGLDNTDALVKLKNIVDKSLSGLLPEEDTDNFNPHLTIGRMKYINDRELLKELLAGYMDHKFMDVNVDQLFFFESILDREGASYKVISSCKLRGNY